MEVFICPFCHTEIKKKHYCPKCKRAIKDSDYASREETKEEKKVVETVEKVIEPVKEVEPEVKETVKDDDGDFLDDVFGFGDEPKKEEKPKVVEDTTIHETTSDKHRSYGFNYKISGRSFKPEDTEAALKYLYTQGTISYMFSDEKAGDFSNEFTRILKAHLTDDELNDFYSYINKLFMIFSKSEDRFLVVMSYLTDILLLRINGVNYQYDRTHLANALANERTGSNILNSYLSIVYYYINKEETGPASEEKQLQSVARFVFNESAKSEDERFIIYLHRDGCIKVKSFGRYRFFTKELAKGENALEKNWCLRTIGKIDKTEYPIPKIEKVPAIITRMFNVDIESISEYFYNLRFASTIYTEITYRDYYLERNAVLTNSEQRFIDNVYMADSNPSFGSSLENSSLQLLYLLLKYGVFNVPESKFANICNYYVGNEKLVRIAQASSSYDVFIKDVLSRLPKNTIRFMGRNMSSAMFFKTLRTLSTSQLIAYVSSFIDDPDGLEALQKVNNLEVVKRPQLENRLKGRK